MCREKKGGDESGIMYLIWWKSNLPAELGTKWLAYHRALLVAVCLSSCPARDRVEEETAYTSASATATAWGGSRRQQSAAAEEGEWD